QHAFDLQVKYLKKILEAVIKGKMREVDLKDIILIDLKDITLDKKDDIIITKVQPGHKSYSESHRVADLSNPSRTKSSNIRSRSTSNSFDEVIILSLDSSDVPIKKTYILKMDKKRNYIQKGILKCKKKRHRHSKSISSINLGSSDPLSR
ncbi:3963_t:CDS:1, partial [Funneliformis caledonium]